VGPFCAEVDGVAGLAELFRNGEPASMARMTMLAPDWRVSGQRA